MITLYKPDKNLHNLCFLKETQNNFVSEVHIKRISITAYVQTLLLRDTRKAFLWLLYFLDKSISPDEVSLVHFKPPQGTDTF